LKHRDSLKWFFVAAILIMATVAAFVFFISPCWDLTKSTGRFALGQFLMQFLLLPAAGVGFFWTIQQIRRAQEVTDLHLYLSNGLGERETKLTLRIPSTRGERKFSFQLLNEGRLVAVWYLVEIRIPNELARFPEITYEPFVGDREKWIFTARSEYWEKAPLSEDGKDFTRLCFKSKGQEAAYPFSKLKLATVTVSLFGNRQYPPYCEVPYVIATDRGKPQTGTLILKLEREPDQGERKSS